MPNAGARRVGGDRRAARRPSRREGLQPRLEFVAECAPGLEEALAADGFDAAGALPGHDAAAPSSCARCRRPTAWSSRACSRAATCARCWQTAAEAFGDGPPTDAQVAAYGGRGHLARADGEPAGAAFHSPIADGRQRARRHRRARALPPPRDRGRAHRGGGGRRRGRRGASCASSRPATTAPSACTPAPASPARARRWFTWSADARRQRPGRPSRRIAPSARMARHHDRRHSAARRAPDADHGGHLAARRGHGRAGPPGAAAPPPRCLQHGADRAQPARRARAAHAPARGARDRLRARRSPRPSTSRARWSTRSAARRPRHVRSRIAQLIGSLPRDEAAELGRLADEVAAERMR